MNNKNEPMAMHGGGLGGTKTISPREARQRRVVMCDLVSNSLSLDEIQETMADKFSMSPAEITKLRGLVSDSLLREYEDSKPTHKAAANRRLAKSIVKAGAARQFGAVAQLEAQLSKIQGTEAPVEQHITVDATIQTATMAVLNEMDPSQIQALVAEEIKRLPEGHQDGPMIIESLSDDLEPLSSR